MVLYFHNPGEIDIRAVTTLGLHAKENSNPIGYFGTGLKYAIASILRWKGDITIFSGDKPYNFTTEQENFRSKTFDRILMNGEPLAFTLEYGKNWLPWAVFRELYANAMDEGGNVSTSPIMPSAGKTVIVVNEHSVRAEYNNRHSIILPCNQHYDHISNECNIINKPSAHIYYRGVRTNAIDMPVTFNILSEVTLTEDRTILSVFGQAMPVINQAISEIRCSELLRAAIENNRMLLLAAQFPTKGSPEYINTLIDLYTKDRIKYEAFHKVIQANKPELLVHKPLELSPFQQRMLDRAIELCARMGLDTSVPINVAELSKSILGEYNRDTKEVWLSPTLFKTGIKSLISTLYEELTHHATGYGDCTLEMQTHLFDTIISIYEEHVFSEIF